MNILIVYNGKLPVTKYGGTERVIWCLGKELKKMGHAITYLIAKGSYCDFAKVIFFDPTISLAKQIPDATDIVHFNFEPQELITKPFIITMHGNCNDFRQFNANTVFVSENHAERFGSSCYVHNGLDWDEYKKPDFKAPRNYFHFLGNASWRVKNVKGAIETIKATKKERLKVLGGYRLNFNMGFRFTQSLRIDFCGMVGGREKESLLENSKGLVFPVRWNEPFGLAITESLYFGCPVFGTPYGSLPELVVKGMGFLSDNKQILAEQVENAERFSKTHCHEYAVEMFNSKKMTEAYLEKYLWVLNGKSLNEKPPQLKEQTKKFLDWK